LFSSTSVHGQTLQIEELKANFLHGFIEFVSWDENPETKQVVIGIIGSSSMVNHLEKSGARRNINNAPRAVHIKDSEQLAEVDLLYVTSGNRNRWPSLVKLAREHNILLVGEEHGFCSEGGAIRFIVRKNRLHFSINAENAKSCGVKVSSKLIDISIGDD